MKKYKIEFFTKKRNGALDKKVFEAVMELPVKNKKEAAQAAYDYIANRKYNDIFPESNDSSIIGATRARQILTVYTSPSKQHN